MAKLPFVIPLTLVLLGCASKGIVVRFEPGDADPALVNRGRLLLIDVVPERVGGPAPHMTASDWFDPGEDGRAGRDRYVGRRFEVSYAGGVFEPSRVLIEDPSQLSALSIFASYGEPSLVRLEREAFIETSDIAVHSWESPATIIVVPGRNGLETSVR